MDQGIEFSFFILLKSGRYRESGFPDGRTEGNLSVDDRVLMGVKAGLDAAVKKKANVVIPHFRGAIDGRCGSRRGQSLRNPSNNCWGLDIVCGLSVAEVDD